MYNFEDCLQTMIGMNGSIRIKSQAFSLQSGFSIYPAPLDDPKHGLPVLFLSSSGT